MARHGHFSPSPAEEGRCSLELGRDRCLCVYFAVHGKCDRIQTHEELLEATRAEREREQP